MRLHAALGTIWHLAPHLLEQVASSPLGRPATACGTWTDITNEVQNDCLTNPIPKCRLQPFLLALQYLHKRGISHRDVKPGGLAPMIMMHADGIGTGVGTCMHASMRPTAYAASTENVLFSNEGSLTLKLADFGLALNLREERAVTRVGTLGAPRGRGSRAAPSPSVELRLHACMQCAGACMHIHAVAQLVFKTRPLPPIIHTSQTTWPPRCGAARSSAAQMRTRRAQTLHTPRRWTHGLRACSLTSCSLASE